MIVVCPEPDCKKQFEIAIDEADKRGHYHGRCVHCGLEGVFRTLAAMEIIEREFEKKSRAQALRGGPSRCETYVPDLSAVVEDVRSLWNVGSIFRTSDGAGVEHVYLCGITGSPPRREIEKVSLGAEQTVSWEYSKSPLEVLRKLKLSGVFLLGLERTEGSQLLSEYIGNGGVSRPASIVVGNEVSGLSRQVLSQCDAVCHLPMRGMKESLNVAVAYGIAAYMVAGK